MDWILNLIIFCAMWALGFFLNVFWLPHFLGCLFYEFPYLLKCYTMKEFNTVQPVLFPLLTVCFWLVLVGIINIGLFFISPKIFIYIYTNTGFITGLVFAIFGTFGQLGNSEMYEHREAIRSRFTIKD